MKSTLKTFALSLVAVMMSTFAFASDINAKKESSPELAVNIVVLDDSQVAVLFNKLDNETVKVSIFDNSGNLVYSQREAKGTTYGKKFNLSALPSGKYTYRISNKSFSTSKVVELK